MFGIKIVKVVIFLIYSFAYLFNSKNKKPGQYESMLDG
jgi:hypothetical protein